MDLCGGTGSWSRPYGEAGYDVRVVTLPDCDVRLLRRPDFPVHGILAAPPCTHFSRAGAWLWPRKGTAALLEGLGVVDACLRLIVLCNPAWWALENPIGRLRDYLGSPAYRFDPWWFGDPWTKRTWLWGRFAEPRRAVWQRPADTRVDVTTKMPSSWKAQRAVTPPGFARAFFNANP